VAYLAWNYAIDQGWPLLRYLQQYLANIGELLRYIPFPQLFLTKYSPFFAGVLLLVAGGALWLRRLARGDRSGLAGLVVPVLITIALYFLVHTMRALFMRSWYYLSFVPLLLLLLGWGIDLVSVRFRERPARRRMAAITLASIVTAGAYMLGIANALRMESRDGVKYRIAMQMNRILPSNARVGAWNAGIYGYFFERGEVVNLDGVVNNGAYRHIRSRSLRDYCRAQGITHLVDDASSLTAMAAYWSDHTGSIAHSLDVLHTLPIPMTTDTTIIGRMDRGVVSAMSDER
jgi:hypothetical protein